MKKALLVRAACMIASVAMGSGKYEPLNIKTGLWQVTETWSATGLPNGMSVPPHTTTYKNCVTQKDLAANPFNDVQQKCSWTVLNSTATDMELKGTGCAVGGNDDVKANVHLKLHVVDQEHVTGSGDWTGTANGQSMSGSASGSGKLVSATCSK
jgi:hypothetical protein